GESGLHQLRLRHRRPSHPPGDRCTGADQGAPTHAAAQGVRPLGRGPGGDRPRAAHFTEGPIMGKITRESLMTLEAYASARTQLRNKVLAHKKHRTIAIGPNVTLVFEDELTMRYQIQEMLRAERIFEADGIQDELDAYNPLVPDGANW